MVYYLRVKKVILKIIAVSLTQYSNIKIFDSGIALDKEAIEKKIRSIREGLDQCFGEPKVKLGFYTIYFQIW